MERIALAIWRNRISPLFDVAKKIHIVDLQNGVPAGNAEALFFRNSIAGKISRFCDLNINTLICGAISKELSLMLTTNGIHVIAFVAGDKDDVLAAYLKNGWVPSDFCMPGCNFRGQRRRRMGPKLRQTFASGQKAGKSKGVKNGKAGFQWSPGNRPAGR